MTKMGSPPVLVFDRPVMRSHACQAFHKPLFPAVLAGLLAIVLFAPPIAAQNNAVPVSADSPPQDISRSLKLRAPPANPPDWVLKTRKPAHETSYVPTGAAGRTEPAPAMSLDKLKELEKSLDTERARHDRLGGRKAGAGSKRTVAIGPVVKAKAVKRTCVLTCVTPIGTKKK